MQLKLLFVEVIETSQTLFRVNVGNDLIWQKS